MTNDSTSPLRKASRKPAILLAAVAMLALAIPAVADAKKGKKKGGPKVTVMTRNVYLGADLTPAIEAANLPAAINAAGEIAAELDSTKFPERAVLLAQEIKDSKADLVGLQEVAKWTDQTPSDGGAPPISPIGDPATDIRYDFLALLEQELANVGAKYKVIGIQEEFEAELPADTDGNPNNGLLGADEDIRLLMRDVILAKKGSKVDTGKVDQGNYVTRFETEVGGLPVVADRGWLSVEATVGGGGSGKGKGKGASASKKGGSSKFRFINTHLEAFGDPTIREAQAKELIAGPAKTKKQVILVGDLNSGLPGKHTSGQYQFQPNDPLAFQAFVDAGFKDNGARDTGGGDPLDPSLVFDHTIDHVLTKDGLKTKKAFVTGTDPSVLTPSGLLASDHGGVVSKLQLKK
jgi:endonuclease/exonuclease/phosphatase family metal-dependent hydrolase